MSTSRECDWTARVQQRLQLREARYLQDGAFVREAREGLLFLHVSKSGGTSLDAFLNNFFPPHEAIPTDLQVRRMVEWDDADWSRYRYFKLEWPYELTARRAPPLHAVTMLRDPVKRIISLYKHLRRADDHTQQYDSVRSRRSLEQEAARTLSLAEWARLRPIEQGGYFRHPYLGMATIGVRNLVDKTDADLDALLIRAKQNFVEKFAFVGLIEDYVRSKQLFCQTFEIPLHYASGEERLNVAPDAPASRNPADTETEQFIRQENRWDAELYDFARQLFVERCERFAELPDLDCELRDVSAPQLSLRPMRGCVETPIDRVPASGLYPAEISPIGLPVRWTGALPVSTLDLIAAWPDHGTLEVHLDIIAVIEPERLGELQIDLDGRSPHSARWEAMSQGTRLIAVFPLDRDLAARTCHQLQITGPTAAPPGSPGEAADDRKLGIGLCRVATLWGGVKRTCPESVDADQQQHTRAA